jgi:hypothetical protein
MLTDPMFYAVAIPAVILYGLTKGGLSGVSLLAIPLMSLIMPPLTAAAIMLPVLLVQDAYSVWTFRASYDRTMLWYTLPGAALGIGAAGLLARFVTAEQVRLAIGLISIAFVANAVLRGRTDGGGTAQPHSLLLGWGLGAVSGFVSFLVHAGGPPYNVYAVPRGLGREAFVGTSTMFFAAVNLLKLPGYLAIGQFDRETLVLSAVLLPLAIGANAAGIWLVRRMTSAWFYRTIYVLTFCIGVKLVADSLL